VRPASYDSWYQTPRGAWIGEREARLLLSLARPVAGQSLLDVGCGTGYFSGRFARAGMQVTGIDPDADRVAYARTQRGQAAYLEGRAEKLPFGDGSFDYAAAVASLCFAEEPRKALAEMWRGSRRGVAMGLLNRQSLLYARKHGRHSYAGARWDTWPVVRRWIGQLAPPAAGSRHGTAIVFPGAGRVARLVEPLFAGWAPWGGFLAVYIEKDAGRERAER